MPATLDSVLWPDSQLTVLVPELARHSNFPVVSQSTSSPNCSPDTLCELLGLEAEPVRLDGSKVEQQLRDLAPGLLHLSDRGYLGLLSTRGRTVQVIATDLRVVRLSLRDIRDAVCAKREEPMRAEIARMVEACGVSHRRKRTVVEALVRERIRSVALGRAWQLRVPPCACFGMQLRQAGIIRRLATFGGAYLGQYLLLLISWWVIGRGAMSGRIDSGSLIAWAALLATLIPLRLLMTLSQGSLAIGAGGLLKLRLLTNALNLDPDAMRRQGVGELLGRVIDAESLESLALGGGLQTLVALLELSAAGLLMSLAASHLQLFVFVLWIAVVARMAVDYWRRRQIWTAIRLTTTHGLIDRMSGHRTRLAQQPRDQWHEGEDEEIIRYLAVSRSLDRVGVRISALAPRGWLIVGLAAIAPEFLSSSASAARLGVEIGTLLLAYQTFKRLGSGLAQLAGAAIAWQQVAPIFKASDQPVNAGSAIPAEEAPETVLDAHDLVFGYSGHGEPVLRGCSLRVRPGEFLLLEGGSGAGKSTLTALLAGIRKPTSGVLLSGGLDRQTLGESGWRRRIALAPQYHENHILASSLAFNLLMGRHWPPTAKDTADADTICRELGLGDLIDRMPGGLQQIIGETGWQLSQGERSRVFLARALLQGSNLVILDESFGALDPQTMRRCLDCVFQRAPALLVVAHP